MCSFHLNFSISCYQFGCSFFKDGIEMANASVLNNSWTHMHIFLNNCLTHKSYIRFSLVGTIRTGFRGGAPMTLPEALLSHKPILLLLFEEWEGLWSSGDLGVISNYFFQMLWSCMTFLSLLKCNLFFGEGCCCFGTSIGSVETWAEMYRFSVVHNFPVMSVVVSTEKTWLDGGAARVEFQFCRPCLWQL